MDPTWTRLLLGAWGLSALLMALLYVREWRRSDASVVDFGWAAGVGLAGVFHALFAEGDPVRRAMVGAVIGAWSARLAAHLLLDRVVGKEEDGRYRTLREYWGGRAHFYFFLFFQFQATWVVLFSAPALIAASNKAPAPSVWDFLGVAVGLGAIAGEMLADRQLARWRADPANKGKTCRQGLWGWSRHPNYFFEWLHWFAYVFFAAGSAWVWGALAGPALMLLFLFKVTGIPHTEKQALASRGEDYRRYQRSVSVFVPLPPKKADEA